MPRCHECGQESIVAAQHPGLCEECHPDISTDFPALKQAIEQVKQENAQLRGEA
jgi:hypothetical protein